MICPVCQHTTRLLFPKGEWRIETCDECGHRCASGGSLTGTHVENVYGDDYFEGGGAGYPNYVLERELLVAHGARYAELLGRYMPVGRVLDVGAAAGFILKGFCDAGWQGAGIEPNARMAEHASRQWGLRVTTGPMETASLGERFDLVSMIQVLPHFYDLHAALRVASEHTAPSGFWLIETWNCDSLLARWAGPSWHEYSPPSVLHWFMPQTLTRLVARYGMRLAATGRPTKKIAARHAKSLLRHVLQDHPSAPSRLLSKALGLIPGDLALPYFGGDLFWALYQKEDARLHPVMNRS